MKTYLCTLFEYLHIYNVDDPNAAELLGVIHVDQIRAVVKFTVLATDRVDSGTMIYGPPDTRAHFLVSQSVADVARLITDAVRRSEWNAKKETPAKR